MTITVYSSGGPRPSAEDVKHAVELLERIAGDWIVDPETGTVHAVAVETLRAAAEPRPVWAAKEVAEALGVDPANLNDVRGLPEPAQRLPRPTERYPDRVTRLWYVDEVEAFAAERRARRERERA